MKKYLSFFKIRFTKGLQYRAAAIAGILTQIFFGLVFIGVYIAFYNSGDANVDITLKQIVSYMWLNQAFFSLISLWHKDNELKKMIKNGNIAYELCRPQNVFSMWYARIISDKLASVTLRCLPLIIFAFLLPEPYNLSLPNSLHAFIFFLISFMISTFLTTSLITFIYIILCLTIDDKGITGIYCSIAEILAGQVVPLPLFPKAISYLASLLPFAYVSDFSFRIYSGNIIGKDIYIGLIIQIAWLIILIILGNIITKKILKKVVVQGG